MEYYSTEVLWFFIPSNSMELSPSWEAISRLATKEYANIIWNPEVRYHVHKSTPLVYIQSIISHPISLRPSLILSYRLHVGLNPSDFPTNIFYVFLFAPIHAMCPSDLILLIIPTIITIQ
jgi:hypothetical protein